MAWHGHDWELLMRIHRQASRPTRRLGRHVRCCPQCRQSAERWAFVSMLIAFALRGPELPNWHPPRWSTAEWVSKRRMRRVVVASLFVIVTVTAIWSLLPVARIAIAGRAISFQETGYRLSAQVQHCR